MKKLKNHKTTTKVAIFAGAAALMALTPQTHAQSSVDNLLNKLEQKGILTPNEARDLRAESDEEADESGERFPRRSSPKSMPDWIEEHTNCIGDFRGRYECSGVDNDSGRGADNLYRERCRYPCASASHGRYDGQFQLWASAGNSSNPRSPWATFGNNTTGGSVTPSDKAQSGIYVGQAFIGWHPDGLGGMTVGRMPMPSTPPRWSGIRTSIPKARLRNSSITDWTTWICSRTLASLIIKIPASAAAIPSSDTFILAWQAGANVQFAKNMSFKIAPVFYTYTGVGSTGNGLNLPFVGQGNAGVEAGVPGASAADLAAIQRGRPQRPAGAGNPAEFNFDLPRPRWARCKPVCLATSPIISKATAARMLLTTPIRRPFRA